MPNITSDSISNGYLINGFALESGIVDASGEEVENNKAMRMTEMIPYASVVSCDFLSRTGNLYIAYYDSEGNFATRVGYTPTQTAVLSSNYPYFRMCFYEAVVPSRTETEFKSWVTLKIKTAIKSELDEKADQANVTAALNTKSDLAETSAALANKVDKSALSLYDNGYSEIPYTLESGDLASDGSEVEQPKAMRMTEMIEIRAYDRYVFDDNTAISPRVCYYDSDGEFVTRTSKSEISTNSRYKYIRLAFYKNRGNISENECKSRFSIQNKTEINKRIEAITLPVTNYIDVDINGGGDYTSLYAAVTSITDSSDINRYVIRLHEGTYDLISEIFGSSGLFNTVGMILPDHVDIVGIGNRDNIIVKAQFDPATVTETLNKNFSAINLKYNNKLENITVIIQNGRYAVHDESNGEFKNYEREVKNCKFIHLGGTNTSYWQSHHAYGHGLLSGCRCYYENCVFETQSTESAACAYGCHNAAGGERFASIVFKSCVFSNSYNNTKGVSIGSMVSGTEDYIIFEGCDFCNTNILVKEQLTTVQSGITIKPKGYANRNIRDKIINDSTGDYTVVEVY